MVTGGRFGEVAGDGEDGGGHEVPVPGAVTDGQPAQGGGKEPGGEGVPGADGGDDVDVEGGDVGDGVGEFSPSRTRRAGSGTFSPSGD
ncbi:hypothetical protein GA0115253_1087327 [Streptomyces sp. Termitarium-T10T-6]|nr:hypothetical protein GA0115253_1087327 [Streptomyces sp. Termitarium-T10T-6]